MYEYCCGECVYTGLNVVSVMRFKCLKAYHAVFLSEFGQTFSCVV